MAFARQNIEKHRLIEMVRMNPILWDCRLPHYKRSDKKKDMKWNELGRAFAVSGERVQRTFTSLREIFRRELNHEKMLGKRFKSKWEYYDAMGFLKYVIRERKTRERVRSESYNPNIEHSFPNDFDEYQYFPAREPKFPDQNQKRQQQLPQTVQSDSQRVPITVASTATNMIHEPIQTKTTELYACRPYSPLSVTYQRNNQDESDKHVTVARRSRSISSSIYVKEEPHDIDEVFTSPQPQPPVTSSSLQTDKVTSATDVADCNNQENSPSSLAMIPKRALATTTSSTLIDVSSQQLKRQQFQHDAKSATTNYYSNCSSSNNNNKQNQRIESVDFDDDDDDLEDVDDDDIDDNQLECDVPMAGRLNAILPKIKESARQVLYEKFGEFLAARLNTLSENVANELMNKILLLVSEK